MRDEGTSSGGWVAVGFLVVGNLGPAPRGIKGGSGGEETPIHAWTPKKKQQEEEDLPARPRTCRPLKDVAIRHPFWTMEGSNMDNKLMLELLTLDLELVLDSGYNTAESTPLDSPSSPHPLDLGWDSLAQDVDRLLQEKKNDDFTAFDMPLQPFVTGTVATFYLMKKEADEDNNGRKFQKKQEDVDITILGLTGHQQQILMKTNLWDRVASCFKPLLPGIHTINATVKNGRKNVAIKGTPASVIFSRDYFSQPLRRIVSWDLDKDAQKPWGICCNTKTEQIWITDRVKNQISVYSPDGTLEFVIGNQENSAFQFFRPTGLAFDPHSDRIFVTDKDNHRVVILSASGQFLGAFGSRGKRPGQFNYPWGIAISPDGTEIAVVDTRNHRLQFFNAAGQFLRQFQVCDQKNYKGFKHLWDYPRGITYNLNGDAVFVTDFNLHTVFQVSVDCRNFCPLVPPRILQRPEGITLDDAGNFLVAEARGHSLKIFAPNGQLLGQQDTFAPNSRLNSPTDVTLLKAGFVATLDNNRRVTIF